MTSITTTIERPGAGFVVDPAELQQSGFLARYSGRTLDAYRTGNSRPRTAAGGPFGPSESGSG